MALLNENVQKQVRQALADLTDPVKLVVFTQGEGGAIECTMCTETRQLAEEVAALSDKIIIETLDFVKDEKTAESYQIDKIPAIAVVADGPHSMDYGIRLYGIPSGYEFGTLIEDIRMVSRGKTDLNPKTIQELKKLDKPVHIQVMVTPT